MTESTYKVHRVLNVTSDWPRLHRAHPDTRRVVLVENLDTGELVLVPIVNSETPPAAATVESVRQEKLKCSNIRNYSITAGMVLSNTKEAAL